MGFCHTKLQKPIFRVTLKQHVQKAETHFNFRTQEFVFIHQ